MHSDRHVEIGGNAEGNTIITGDGNVVIIQTTRPTEEEHPVAPPKIGDNPYLGLLAFQEKDADRFFGRESLTEHLWEVFCELHKPTTGGPPTLRLLPILGPSGSGKSSVARAGLIPELARRPLPELKTPRVAVITPGSHPIEALAGILANIVTKEPTPVAKTREFAGELREVSPHGNHDGLRRIADSLPDIAASPLIIFIDQFEEIYSLCEDVSERAAFIANILHAAADVSARVSVILTLRSDFLAQTQQHPLINHAIADRGVIVPAMNSEELRQAISEPARRAGHPIDDGTVNLLISETEGREGALPLLQFALTRIWEGMAEGVEPAETIQKIGGVGGALAREAQHLYEGLTDEDRAIARRAFLGLIRLGEGTRDTRRRVPVSNLVAYSEELSHVQEVLRIFSRPGARLMTLSADLGGLETVEVSHETLFEHWDMLRKWLNTSRDDLRFHRRLAEATGHWDGQGRPDGSLWRSPDLDLLRNYHSHSSQDMTEVQIEFFRGSEGKERRVKRLKRMAVASLAGLTLIAAGAAYYANEQRIQALTAQSKALSTVSRQVTGDGDATLGMLLALEALPKKGWQKRPFVPSAEASLLYALFAQREKYVLKGHDGGINKVEFSLTGKLVATASLDGTAGIWNVSTGQSTKRFFGHEGQVYSAVFSSDEKKLLTASSDKTARIWSIETGKAIPLVDHTDHISEAFFSFDDKRIVTASYDGTLRIWDAETGKVLKIFMVPGNASMPSSTSSKDQHSEAAPNKCNYIFGDDVPKNAVMSSSLSPDSRRLVTASVDCFGRLWDVASGQVIKKLPHQGPVLQAVFSPDGRRIATASWENTENVKLWDGHSGKPIATLTGHQSGVERVVFSNDGKLLATTSADSTARLWDGVNGNPLGILEGHKGLVQDVQFSPNGKWLITVSADGTTRLWDVITKKIVSVFYGHIGKVWAADFSPNGRQVITGGEDATARIWDVQSQIPVTNLKGHTKRVHGAKFSPDKNLLITVSDDETARIWDIKTGKSIALSGHQGPVWYAVFSSEGKRVVTTSTDGNAIIWDTSTGKLLHILPNGDGMVNHADFSPDGQRVVTGGPQGARLWNAVSGELIKVLDHSQKPVYFAEFSPDGQRIATGSQDGSVRFWNGADGELIATMEEHEGPVINGEFSPDSQQLVTVSWDRTARLWDTKTGKQLAILEGHEETVRLARFSRDGRLVVTASSDNRALIWNAASGKSLVVLIGHQGEVTDASFSKDGRLVFSVSEDSTTRIWHTASGLPVLTLEGHSDAVSAVLPVSDRQVVTTSWDSEVKLWELPIAMDADWIEYARKNVPRQLTDDERRLYLGNLSVLDEQSD